MKNIIYSLMALLILPLAASLAAEQKNDPQYKGEFIYMRDYGTDDVAYLTLPENQPKAGIVLIPDGHGVDAWMKKLADQIAAKDYIVLVMDLYNGNVTTSEQQAARMETDLMEKGVLASMETATRFYKQSPRFVMDKVFVISFGSVSRFTTKFATKKDLLLNGVVLINPNQWPKEAELRKLLYPVQAQLGHDSPLAPEIDAMMKKLGNPKGVIDIRFEEPFANGQRRLDEGQWQEIEGFMQRNSATEPRDKGFFEKIFD